MALRVFHALSAMVWLGGGVYYFVAVRPQTREDPDGTRRNVAVAAQSAYREWMETATIVLLASGTILMFDRLSGGQGGLLYAAILAAKVVAALIAFWLVSLRPRRSHRAGRTRARSRPEIALGLGVFAFTVGVVLSSIWQ